MKGRNKNSWRPGSPLPSRPARVLSGYANSRSRDLLRDILREHTADEERDQLARRVVSHLELSGLELDEEQQVNRKRPPARSHST